MYILEHKTFGKHPTLDTLRSNDQFLAYLWLLTRLGIGEVGGLAYDGMWKRATPPKGRTFDDLFVRLPLQRPKVELANFERMLAGEVLDMATNPHIYINRRWEGCFDCSFNEPCLTFMRGEDVEHVMKGAYMKRPKSDRSYVQVEE